VRQTDTTIAWSETPKGTEPQGRSRPYPALRVLHSRNTSVLRWWEAASGGTASNPPSFGKAASDPGTREYPGGEARPRSCRPQGEPRCGQSGLGRRHRLEDAPNPRLRPGKR
jgi:hypothetical protein